MGRKGQGSSRHTWQDWCLPSCVQSLWAPQYFSRSAAISAWKSSSCCSCTPACPVASASPPASAAASSPELVSACSRCLGETSEAGCTSLPTVSRRRTTEAPSACQSRGSCGRRMTTTRSSTQASLSPRPTEGQSVTRTSPGLFQEPRARSLPEAEQMQSRASQLSEACRASRPEPIPRRRSFSASSAARYTQTSPPASSRATGRRS
mmetsp:Transcript_6829/g.21307  ORF Transcript_6829/g.21307 Transcript_6829/m.21307 type:complete len:207 (-) Transcript_6829:305-925(-)